MRGEPEPAASVEQVVAALVKEVAPGRVEPRGDTVLVDLGLDSLAFAELATAVEERFGVRLPDSELEAPATVWEVASAIESRARVRARVSPGVGRGQRTGKALVGWIFRLWCRLGVRGAEHVPMEGAVILAANHRSMLDVPLLVIAAPRPTVFMAKLELFGDPVRAWLWDWLGGFPVNRSISDIRALDTALAILQEGHCLGLYPEGTRSKTGEMLPFLKGAAWLALRTGATIVPCGIRGTERRRGLRRLLPFKVRIAFGDPIPVEREEAPRSRREKAEALTGRILEGVTALTR
jgi:1-acyl-sn-glycerol-3-phosphate acyltransferase